MLLKVNQSSCWIFPWHDFFSSYQEVSSEGLVSTSPWLVLHYVTWARNFVCTISMQNQVKMFRDVSPTFSMDIAPKWPYFSGKTIFLEPRGVSKIDFNIFLRPIWLICHYKMETGKRLILAILQVMSTDFTQIWLKITIYQNQL